MKANKRILVSFLEGVNDEPLEAQNVDAVCALMKGGFGNLVQDFPMTLNWGKEIEPKYWAHTPCTDFGKRILAAAIASKA